MAGWLTGQIDGVGQNWMDGWMDEWDGAEWMSGLNWIEFDA